MTAKGSHKRRRTILIIVGTFILTMLVCGCSKKDQRLSFPPGFLFGSSVAGFQVDMGCPNLAASLCEDPNSDWYQFITSQQTLTSGSTHLNGDPPSSGPGHWELYASDFDRAANELKSNGLRMSIEWSRIFPTSTVGVTGYTNLRAIANLDAINHYHAMFDALKARNLKPLVTLNHYTLPTWIHDGVGCHLDITTCSPKGWVDKDVTVAEIAKYAGFAAKEFGSKIDLWATLNEPFAVMFPGFVWPSGERTNPPAVTTKFAEAKIVLAGLIEAHARMYDAIKANDLEDADGDGKNSMVGVVYAMAPVKPAEPTNTLDVQAAKNTFYLWNMVYLNAVVLGQFDGNLDGNAVYRADLANRMDYLGINYYTRITVGGLDRPVFPDFSALSTFKECNRKGNQATRLIKRKGMMTIERFRRRSS